MTDTKQDPLYDKAVSLIRRSPYPCVSLLQRALNVSYVRAVRLVEQMRAAGVTKADGIPIPQRLDHKPDAEVEREG